MKVPSLKERSIKAKGRYSKNQKHNFGVAVQLRSTMYFVIIVILFYKRYPITRYLNNRGEEIL